MEVIYVTRNNRNECTSFVVKYNDEYYSINPKYLEYPSGIVKIGKEYGIMRFADFVPYLTDPTDEEKEEAKKYEQNIIGYAETNPVPLYDFDYIETKKKEETEMEGGNNIDLVTATATETEDEKRKKEKEDRKKAMKLFGLKGEENDD